MSLITAKYVTASAQTALQFNSETGWRSVSRGLRLVVLGYVVLIAGTPLGLALLRLGLSDAPLIRTPAGATAEDRDLVLLMALGTLGLTALFSYGLVLVGQWHCLMYSPQSQHAKELMYVCFNCVLMASLLNGLGAYLDGGSTYAALRAGPDELDRLDLWSASNLLQVGSAALGLLGAWLFSGYLRTVASCLQDKARARSVDVSMLLMGLLLGGSVGALFLVQRLSFRAQSVPWLVAGWLFCFALHLNAVHGVSRCLQAGLRRGLSRTMIRVVPGGAVAMHTLSGLHRMVKRPQDQPRRGGAPAPGSALG
jgi:hypothetical protein